MYTFKLYLSGKTPDSVAGISNIKAGLDVIRAAQLPPEQIKSDVVGILNTLEGVDEVSVLLVHAAADTPDANVRAIFEAATEYAQSNAVTIDTDMKLSHIKGT